MTDGGAIEADGNLEVGIDEGDLTGREMLARLYAEDGPPDLEVFGGPLHWPSIPAVDLAAEFRELRDWVEGLVARFPHLDHSVIPNCWWRHNGHVEALQALRDHEQVSYADSAPRSAATSWHREFGFIEARLREWAAHSGCASQHREPLRPLRPTDDDAWDGYVEAEVERRQGREIAASAE